MSKLTKRYHELVEVLEKNVKDPQELEMAKRKLIELSLYYAEIINSFLDMQDNMETITKNIKKLQGRVDNIEEDIYIDSDEIEDDETEETRSDYLQDNDYEFEITCPYCDYEFITDSSYKNENSIECPKCHKTIELDWNNDEECNGECRDCRAHCYENEDEYLEAVSEEDENYNVDVKPSNDEKKKNKDDQKNNENEDDM